MYLDIKELLINLLHGHAASEDTGDSEVPPVSGVTGRHHVPSVEHLLGELGDRERPEQNDL